VDRANWTAAELATYLDQTKGIVVSESTMRAFCTKQGVRPYRPTYHDLTGDPVQQEAARQDLDAFKKTPPPAHSSCSVKMKPGSP
jgi:transposase